MQLSLRVGARFDNFHEREILAHAPRLTLLISACAGLALVVADATWMSPVSIQPASLGLLFILAVSAINFPLPATPRRRIDASVAVYFACLLLYGTPVGMAVVGISALTGRAILAIRANRGEGSLARALEEAMFTAALLMLATAAGGAVYFGLLPHSSPAPLLRMDNLWALPAAAAVMAAVNTLGAGLRAGRWRRPVAMRLGLPRHPGVLLEPVVLYMTGVLMAVATYRYTWAPILMAAPIALVYSSLRRTIGGLLLEQAVSAVEAMADVVDMRDAYTYHHSQRVARYAVQVATEMGMRREQVEEIRLAARVHDLGKIGVPDRVLLKAGRLNAAERELVELHPELGYEILSRFPEYVRGRHLVLSHHERPDGMGYPQGLRGSQVPMGAYVIAVADALDAMTSSRPYRTALSLSQAMAVFAEGAGTQWHLGAVSALQRLVAVQGPAILLEAPPGWKEPAAERLERQAAARRWLDTLAQSSGRDPAQRQPAGNRSHHTIRMPATD